MNKYIIKPIATLLSFLLAFMPVAQAYCGDYQVRSKTLSNSSSNSKTNSVKGQVNVGQTFGGVLAMPGGMFGGPFTIKAGCLYQFNANPSCVLTSFTNGECSDVSPTFTWDYQDKDQEPQQKFQIQLSAQPDFPSANLALSETVVSSKAEYTPSQINEGIYYWRLRVSDGFDWSGWQAPEKPIIIDRTPPTGSIKINADAQFTKSISVTLDLSATDGFGQGMGLPGGNGAGIVGMKISNDKINWQEYGSFQPSLQWNLDPQDGEKTVWANFKDKAGHWISDDKIPSDKIILDTTAPIITPLSPTDGLTIADPRPVISAAFTEAGSGINQMSIRMSLNGQMASYTYDAAKQQVTFTPSQLLMNGNYTVTLDVVDKAGNQAAQAKWSFTVDIRGIDFYNVSVNPKYARKDTEVTIQFSSTQSLMGDPAVTINDKLAVKKSSAVNSYAYTYKAGSSDVEGWALLKIQGNASSAGTAGKILSYIDNTKLCIDLTNPALTITKPQDNSYTDQASAQVEGTVVDANLASLTINNASVAVAGNNTFSYAAPLTEGLNTITTIATDAAGNSTVAAIPIYYVVSSGTEITSAGGAATSADGLVTVVVPPGAVDSTVQIIVSTLPLDLFAGAIPQNTKPLVIAKVEVMPQGATFLVPVTLRYNLPAAEVPGTSIDLGLYDEAQGKILLQNLSRPIQADGYTVDFLVPHFSVYAALKGMTSQGAPIGSGVQIPMPDMFTGAFSHSVPIAVAPGRKGMQPALSLVYRSGNPNSWAGFGFSLNPGYIERSTKFKAPSYDDANDTFYFITDSGTTELVHLIDNVYQARIESSFAKFFKEADDSWKVVQKDGMTLYFGRQSASKITNPNGTFRWALEKTVDTNGNYMIFSYAEDQGQLYLSRIEYTGNESVGIAPANAVDFILEPRDDVIYDYKSGSGITTARRLAGIDVKADNALVRSYVLKYKYSAITNRSLLTSITQYGTDGKTASPSVAFSYQEADSIPGAAGAQDINLGSGSPLAADFNGDAKTDVASVTDSGDWIIGASTGAGFTKSVWLSGFKPQDLAAIIVGDFNADTKADIGGYDKNSKQWKVALSTGSSFSSPSSRAGPEVGGGDIVTNGSFANNSAGWSSWASNSNCSWDSGSVKVWRDAQGTSGGCDGGSGDFQNWDGYFEQEISETIAAGSNAIFTYGWMQYQYTNNGSYNCCSTASLIRPDGSEIQLDYHADDYRGQWAVFSKDISSYINQTGRYRIRFRGWGYVHGYKGGGYAYAGAFFDEAHLVVNNVRVLTGDFNADGFTDLVLFKPTDGSWQVSLSDGTNFAQPNTWLTNFGVSTEWEPITGDFNGDGFTDVGVFNKQSGEWKIAICDGAKFVIDSGSNTWISGFGVGMKLLTGDFNQDGLTDIGYFDSTSGNWTIALSNGKQFTPVKSWLSGFGANKIPFTGDFNADGLTDAACFDQGAGNWQASITTGAAPDLLTKIDNGIGGLTDITYSPSSACPGTNLPFTAQVVTSVKITDTLPADSSLEQYVQNFSYEGGYYNVPDREFCGFAKVKAVDPITGNFTETYLYQGKPGQDGALKAQIEKILAYDGSGNLISQTLNTWEVKQAGPKEKSLGFPSLKEVNATVWEENKASLATRTKFTYDNIGNLLEEINEGDISKTGNKKSASTDYSKAYEKGFNRPVKTALKDKDGNIITRKSFEYDEKGNLIKETLPVINPVNNQTDTATTLYSYDSFGNVTSTINPLGNSVLTDYETKFYTYPEKVTNTLGHTISYVYDPRFGAVVSVTDANAATSATFYDVLGRVTSVKNALDETTATYTYPDFNTKITTNALNLTSKEYMDGLGRKYKTISSGERGSAPKEVVSEVFYNNRGFVDRESLPHYIDELPSAISYIRYEYDTRGRVKKTISDFPGDTKDAESSISYIEPLYVETIDPLNHKKGTRKDVYGNIIEVTEFIGDSAYKTSYEYDTQNNLVKTVDSRNNTVQIVYDSAGRKIQMIDPDMGAWSYEYDKVGNLIKQTDAKAQVLQFEYDALNRLTKKWGLSPLSGTVPIFSVEYFYDDTSKPNCIGRLSKVTDPSGSTEFFYDKLGREVKSVKTVDATDYTVERAYDILDRLTSLKYPDNEVVNYTYDINSGLLEKVAGAAQTYVQNIVYNAKGQILNIQYGNNTATDYTYGDDLRLSRILAQNSTEKLQDLSYDFDKNGNIIKLTDNLRSNARAFTYDTLDRLTKAENIPNSKGGFDIFTYEYNSIGNMTYKSDVGIMEYGLNAGPHAVTKAGSLTYSYDANGNMIKAGWGRTMEYDAENRLIKVTGSANGPGGPPGPGPGGNGTGVYQSNFVYDGDGGRVKQTCFDATGSLIDKTIYIGSLYEVYSGSSSGGPYVSSTTRKHIFAGANRVSTVTTQKITGPGPGLGGQTITSYAFYHTDHLGSSNVISDKDGKILQRLEYTPYGSTAVEESSGSAASGVTHKFTGKELDETGLYYYGARYYDPTLGRFITPDTIVQSPFDPQTLNRYTYCRNNPLNYIDPTGHKWSWDKAFHNFIAGVAGGVTFALTGNPILAGMAFGAVLGGFEGGWKGALMGAGMGALAGAGVGLGIGIFGPVFGYTALVASAGYTYATQGWEGLGYMACSIGGSIVGYNATNAIGEAMSKGPNLATQNGSARIGGGNEEVPNYKEALKIDYDANGNVKDYEYGYESDGVKIYRRGSFGDGTYIKGSPEGGSVWSPKNPLTTPNYAQKFGLPKGNSGSPDWIVGGHVKVGYGIGPAPSSHNNPNNAGGESAIFVKNPNDVILDWFHMPDKD